MTSRNLTIAAVVAVAGLYAADAQAQDSGGLYVKAFGGSAMLRDTDVRGAVTGQASFEAGPIFGAALGYDAGDRWLRPEIEFAYRSGDADAFVGGTAGDFASTTLMINGYHDFDRVGAWTPYVGAGVGYVTEIDFDISGGIAAGEYNDRGGFAWQAMAGAGYAVSDRIGLSGELRYFDAGSRTLTDPVNTITADYATFEVVLGVRYRF